jgi:phosphopantothenoylcysteine decarboxylase/phosphopantothenate--cysteine ligase
MLTSVVLATQAPVILCPAMNTGMYENEKTVDNLDSLKKRGYFIVESGEGFLACGDSGKGRMAEPAEIVNYVDNMLTPAPDYRGKTAIVTAGATREPVDGVRFLSNRSSGKMGVQLATALLERGANVILIAGFMTAEPPKGVTLITVETTLDMYGAVMKNLPQADIVIKAAAPSDYRVENVSPQKIKSEKLQLNMIKNPDIAREVGKIKGDKKLVVFAAETQNLMEYAYEKMQAKNADLMVANDVTAEGAGFDCDTNIAAVIERSGAVTALPLMSKYELAHTVLDILKESCFTV